MLEDNFSLEKNEFLVLVNRSGLDKEAGYIEELYLQVLNVIANTNALYKINVQDFEPSSVFKT